MSAVGSRRTSDVEPFAVGRRGAPPLGIARAGWCRRLCRGAMAAGALALTAVLVASCAGGKHPGHGGPVGTSTVPSAGASATGQPGGTDDGHGGTGSGLSAAHDGFQLQLLRSPSEPGQQGELSFRITGPSGQPQTRFQVEQERLMHVYVVRKDLADFYHTHPDMTPDGTWSVPLTIRNPGPYRAFTEFVAVGEQNRPHHLVLGTDFEVAGRYSPEPLPAPAPETSVDGYTLGVKFESAADMPAMSMLMIRITQGGAPVTDLEPYLGALAHITAFHQGDLAAAHVHPHLQAPGELMCHVSFPEPGLYRLFIQFQTKGQLRTAPITVRAQ
ncbi:MAG: hypothetical protein QJR12_02345 [Mycobacterium sp.]|uniref:hypothetical protein n=1 Tax=Mycobacterium sp. TaxID=1785 RepID=UPI00261FD681|nr:hypothetical protein [Mycobacterium sp.]MDI3313152.1 hypothetical protein [Mycobacterium sp.]